MSPLSRETRGVIPIVPTPFGQGGDLALGDVGRLVDYYEACGVCGLTILGVMGEAGKLTTREIEDLVGEFLAQADGRLPVIVGVSGSSLAASAELGTWAVERGAFGVMLQPLSGLKEDSAVAGFFEAYAEKTRGRVPVCVQDYPTASGVHLSLAAWSRISRLESVFMLKHEPFPGLQKLTRIRRAEAAGDARRICVLTSNNALHLSQELARGADGAMVGVAYTDLIREVCGLYWEGLTDRAYDLYDALLPLIRHESQGPFGLAIRKEILRRRGALTSNTVRYPGSELDREDLLELGLLMGRLERRLSELSIARLCTAGHVNSGR
jgi:4-hydroxy-tetrahydrodipicolinate synthase